MSLGYLLRRVVVFVLVMWAAMTLIFFLPKLAPGRDPIQERMAMLAATGGANTANIADMVKAYQTNFGLDQPLYIQYFRYLGNIVRLDFNYSLAQYPAKVIDLITISLPWTVGLLTMTTLISFGLGSLLGGLLAWPKAPRWLGYLIPPLVTLSAIPYFLLGIIFVYVFAFVLKLFPLGGGSAFGVMPTISIEYYADILYHSLLPALSIVAAALVVPRVRDQGRTRSVLGYLQRNPQLVAGLLMIGALVLFWSLGSVLVDVKTARPLSAQPELEPSFK